MTDTQPHLMIIDDDQRFRDRLALSMSKRGYQVLAFAEGQQAIKYLSTQTEDQAIKYAIVDLKLAGEWGLNVVEELITIQPQLIIIVLTAYGSIATAIEALKLGALNYLQKPVSIDEIENALLNKSYLPEQTKADDVETASLARVEWEHINRVLTECDGNIRQSAQKLGMHRRTLQRKLAKFPVLK